MGYRLAAQNGDTVAVPQVVFAHLPRAEGDAVRVALYLLGGGAAEPRTIAHDLGLKSIEAAKRAQAGEGGAAIQKAMEAFAPRVEASFVIDRLDYLYKGGRCSALAALGANLLHLKPCIEVRNGKMGVGRKYRGAYEKVLRQYAHDRLHGREDIDRERAFITWSTCPQPALDAVRAVCREEGHFEELLETQAGCTICNHCGPNTLGVLFVRKA